MTTTINSGEILDGKVNHQLLMMVLVEYKVSEEVYHDLAKKLSFGLELDSKDVEIILKALRSFYRELTNEILSQVKLFKEVIENENEKR